MHSLAEIAQKLKTCRAVLITAHIEPDGDAIGSVLAMGLALQQLDVAALMFSADDVPKRYQFLVGTNRFYTHRLPTTSFDCVLTLDCADSKRLQPIWGEIQDKQIINIDHHPTNELFGHLNYVDHTAAATGELVFALLQELGCQIDLEIAKALYVAISTDTGSFKFESTTARTHTMAAELIAAGVNPGALSPLIFDLQTPAALAILRQALSSLTLSADGKIAWIVLTDADMKEAQAHDEDLGGVINYAKNIVGVEVGLIFREQADGTIKVGFRSHQIDVAKVAASFGGGGHVRASGCSLAEDLPTALQLVLASVSEEINA
ncbi:MAG TPA: bifunctional oligoribonuclease/PAP phosphatase NrnA [Oscillospiraceae bacterium]|nr:bifunctional oligoribonuclease/PAP phosphatase NrnA [Oscillospiraceae bacterium]